MRINAYLSLAGVASRRKADALIKSGKVSVNGQKAQLNSQVEAGDEVTLDGKKVSRPEFVYILLNKPAGYLTTLRDPEGRPTVMDLLKTSFHLKPVGRLDFNTSGALLLTNDGQLVNELIHPKYKFKKVYQVQIIGNITDEILNKLSIGIELEDGLTAPAKAVKIGPDRIELTIHEGRNRQVRRMMEAVGLRVKKLHRSAFGPITTDNLKMGQNRQLSADELNLLKAVRIGKYEK